MVCDGGVEELVQLPALVGAAFVLENFKGTAQGLKRFLGNAPCGKARGFAFKEPPDCVNFGEFFRPKRLQDGPAITAQLDHSHRCQLQKRLSNGGAAYRKKLRHRRLCQAFPPAPAALQQAVDDTGDDVRFACAAFSFRRGKVGVFHV